MEDQKGVAVFERNVEVRTQLLRLGLELAFPFGIILTRCFPA